MRYKKQASISNNCCIFPLKPWSQEDVITQSLIQMLYLSKYTWHTCHFFTENMLNATYVVDHTTEVQFNVLNPKCNRLFPLLPKMYSRWKDDAALPQRLSWKGITTKWSLLSSQNRENQWVYTHAPPQSVFIGKKSWFTVSQDLMHRHATEFSLNKSRQTNVSQCCSAIKWWESGFSTGPATLSARFSQHVWCGVIVGPRACFLSPRTLLQFCPWHGATWHFATQCD